jgi:hypothetical protein
MGSEIVRVTQLRHGRGADPITVRFDTSDGVEPLCVVREDSNRLIIGGLIEGPRGERINSIVQLLNAPNPREGAVE